MKKLKIDLHKIIRVKPKMVKEGPDVGILFAMILGFLLGMILITLIS
jgi:tetrahydromethanopterin S-methyltransferase subunit G